MTKLNVLLCKLGLWQIYVLLCFIRLLPRNYQLFLFFFIAKIYFLELLHVLYEWCLNYAASLFLYYFHFAPGDLLYLFRDPFFLFCFVKPHVGFHIQKYVELASIDFYNKKIVSRLNAKSIVVSFLFLSVINFIIYLIWSSINKFVSVCWSLNFRFLKVSQINCVCSRQKTWT